MKNIDFKKLAIFIGIIAALIIAIILLVFGIGKDNKLSKEELEKAENYIVNNVLNITEGYETKYNGIDALFASNKVLIEKIDAPVLINAGIKYAIINGWDTSIPSYKIKQAATQGFPEKQFAMYEGELVRKAIKELYNIDFKDQNAIDLIGYKYNYYYIPDVDVYIKDIKNSFVNTDGYDIDYKITESSKKDDKLYITIALAYTYDDGEKVYYSNDADNSNIIFESTEKEPEILKDKINSFNKYKITLKKVKDKLYFESIEKLK